MENTIIKNGWTITIDRETPAEIAEEFTRVFTDKNSCFGFSGWKPGEPLWNDNGDNCLTCLNANPAKKSITFGYIESIENLWNWACSGEIDNLKQYYVNDGISNRRYFRFGKEHSLIAGALRNGNFETVDYLLSVGETVNGESEQQEMTAYYNNRVVKAAENLVDYYRYHNKNLTRKQYELFDDLAEILKELKP